MVATGVGDAETNTGVYGSRCAAGPQHPQRPRGAAVTASLGCQPLRVPPNTTAAQCSVGRRKEPAEIIDAGGRVAPTTEAGRR